jgi:beta-glucosidase
MTAKFIVMLTTVAAALCMAAVGDGASIPAQSVPVNGGQSTARAAGNSAAAKAPAEAEAEADRFALQLLAHLSLEEKVGQMIQADIASISPAQLRRYKLGSILAGGNAAPGNFVHAAPQAWLDLTNAYVEASLSDAGSAHPPIPILFGIDAVHGHAKVRGASIFPHNVGLGAAHDPELIRRIGQATAAEVAATGIDWTFAPTVAVVRDVRWGRSFESYSESPELVAAYAPAMVTGLQGELGTAQFMAPGHTLSSVKHFVGDGGTLAGRDQGDTVASEAQLLEVHAAGYPAAIKAGAMIVMASYNSWNGIKMHGNHHLLTDVLKGRMGFNGFVVGDWNAQEQLPGCTKSDCPAAILAGVDMLMAPDGWQALYDNMLTEARSGAIPPARIDDAVRRILRVKAMAGLFDRTPSERRSAAGHFEELGSAAHRAIAREAVRKSLVLLKNARATLPLNPRSHVLVAGAAADDIGIQCGGWTVDWQGNHNSNADFPGATSIFAGIDAALRQSGGSATLSRDGSFVHKPDVAIVVFGEGPYAEFEGDRETLEYSPQDKTDLRMLRRLRALGIPTVSIFLSGRPLWVNPEINASDAFVAAWLPGSEGGGIADVLFRQPDGTVPFDFTGRLAFSWPATAMPVRFDAEGRASGAVYANGFGLTYRSAPPAAAVQRAARQPVLCRTPDGALVDVRRRRQRRGPCHHRAKQSTGRRARAVWPRRRGGLLEWNARRYAANHRAQGGPAARAEHGREHRDTLSRRPCARGPGGPGDEVYGPAVRSDRRHHVRRDADIPGGHGRRVASLGGSAGVLEDGGGAIGQHRRTFLRRNVRQIRAHPGGGPFDAACAGTARALSAAGGLGGVMDSRRGLDGSA